MTDVYFRFDDDDTLLNWDYEAPSIRGRIGSLYGLDARNALNVLMDAIETVDGDTDDEGPNYEGEY